MSRLKTIGRRIGLIAVNCWLVFHVFSIFISPAGMPPASPLLMDAATVSRPYNELLFLNHGYHFFAPDPGPSTLISYSVPREGNAPIRGTFPTTDIAPRLLYHRYFMLAENVRAFPDETHDRVIEAYARHFSARHNANEISMYRVSHEPSSISRVLAGGKLDDPETFFREEIGTYQFDSAATFRASDRAPVAEMSLAEDAAE